MKWEIENEILINSYPRCEICFNNIDFEKDNKIKEYYKRCINCGSWYHSICELEFFGRNFSNNKCYSCNMKLEKVKKCIICKKKFGMMINCNKNKWIHILCLKSFDFFFNIKAPIEDNIFTDSIIKAKSKKCDICNERSLLVIKCSKCNLQFHPFCAFKANFLVKNANSYTNFPCCKHHLLYSNNMINNNLKDNNSIRNINYEQKYKEILSFNFKKIKDNIHLSNGIYYKKNHSLNKKSADIKNKKKWKSYNIYFQDFNHKQIDTFINTTQINDNNFIPQYDYKLSEFVYRNFHCYLLFKIKNLDINSLNYSEKLVSPENLKFLNKKRLFKRQFFDIKDNIDDKIFLKRAFGLSKNSTKILYLEALARKENLNLNLDCKYNFIEKEIKIKETMLNIISKRNSTIISKLMSKLKEYKLKKENHSIKIKKRISKINYLTIIKALSESLKSHYNEKKEIEKINKSKCCVCFNENNKSNIIKCKKCNIRYHINCYGLYNIPKEEYYCDICKKNLNNDNNIYCCLCQRNKGVMKFINEFNCWVHITCALISNYIDFKNYRYLKGIKCSVKIQELVNNNYCYFCNSNKGELFKCNNCYNFSHFFCAYFNGALFSFENNNNSYKKILRIDFCVCNDNYYISSNKINNNNLWNKEKRLFEIKYRQLIYQNNEKDL